MCRAVPKMGAIMETPRSGTGCLPPGKIQLICSVHTAVHKGIAVFFCSTFFPFSPPNIPIHNLILQNSASALWRVRFLLAKKEGFCRFSVPVRRRSNPDFKKMQVVSRGHTCEERGLLGAFDVRWTSALRRPERRPVEGRGR